MDPFILEQIELFRKDFNKMLDQCLIRLHEKIIGFGDICNKCHGSGNLIISFSPIRFEKCPRCLGRGVSRNGLVIPSNSPTIIIHSPGNVSGNNEHVFNFADFPDKALMAHVMHKANIFPSVNQARKNGWDSPLVRGEWIVTKKKIKIKVE